MSKTGSVRALALCLAALLGIVSSPASAQPWPAKPITIVDGFPAGAGTDIVLRMYQEALEKDLGAALVFEYKPGAGGNVGSEYVSKAAPDGYTLLIGTAGTHGINAALYKKLAFDVEADFTPIAPLADVPNVLSVNPSVIDAKSVKEFIAIVKAAPGKFNYSSTGNGASTHLGFAQFNAAAGLEMVHVPYKEGQPGIHSVPGDGRGVLQLCTAADGPRPMAGGQGAAARRGHQDAARHLSRRPDGRRSRAAGFRERDLVRAVRAQRARRQDRRAHQRRRAQGAREPGSA
jgi:hypothetical protein